MPLGSVGDASPIWIRLRERGPLALAVAVATAMLYAEGVLKSGWIEVTLLAPVGWFLWVSQVPSLLPNLLVSLLSLCLAASALDLCLRPIIGAKLHYTPSNMFARKLPELPIVGRWDPNVSYRGEAYGDLAAIVGEPALRKQRVIVFETDTAGFRNRDIEGPVDVVVLGDSFSAGVGITQEQIFTSLLERGGHRVYNLSYPGGPYDQFVNFAIEGPRLSLAPGAWLIWTLYEGNDLDDGYGTIWDPKALPRNGELAAWAVRFRTFRNRSPFNQVMQGLRARLNGAGDGVIKRRLPDGTLLLLARGHEAWGERSQVEIERHQNFPGLERSLAAVRDLAAARQMRLGIVIFPTKGEVYRWALDGRPPRAEDEAPSGFAQAVQVACRRLQMTCVDAKPFFVREARRLFDSSGELLWWRDDTHLNGRGHEAVAALVAQELFHEEPSPRP